MSTKTQQWNEKASPARLERRFEFDDYHSTREFLDRAAELSKRTQVYPDVSFGRTYVNMTLYMEQGANDVQPMVREFAHTLEGFASAVPA